MKSYRVVAVNGGMSLPAGWSLPIIQDGEECHVIGDEAAQGFRADELAGLQEQGLIRIFQSPVDFSTQVAEQETEVDIDFHEGLFPTDLYVLYFDHARFEHLDIDIDSVLTGPGMLAHPQDEDTLARRVFVVGRLSLIRALEEMCDRLDLQIMERLARHDWASSSYLDDEDLRFLAKCYYDLSFNRSGARRAIVRRGLVIQKSPDSDMLEEWLVAASRRWSFNSSLTYWSKKMTSVLETCKTCAYARRLYHDMFIEMIARLTPGRKLPSKSSAASMAGRDQFLVETQETAEFPGTGVAKELIYEHIEHIKHESEIAKTEP